MTEVLLYAAAPVFAVDGDVNGDLAGDLVRLEVEEDTAGLKRLDARFMAHRAGTDVLAGRLDYLDGAVLDFGRTLRATVGEPARQRVVFEGKVTALELEISEGAVPTVRVLAEDALMDLRMTRRSMSYREVTDAEIAETVAGRHGLRADVSADGPRYDVVQQLNQSDLAFLRDRARSIGAELWVLDGTLHMAARARRTATSLTFVQGSTLLSAELRGDLAQQRTAVRVTGYDAQGRAAIDEVAGGEVIDAEVAGGRTGPAVLGSAFGEREAHIARQGPLTGAEAGAWARAEMLRRSRAFVTVRATVEGAPDLVVGSRVRLERVGAPFEGDGYYVTRVRHTYDLSLGLRSHFDAERATLGAGVAP